MLHGPHIDVVGVNVLI